MADILSLAMKINADASGVVKNLTPAERALERLGKEVDKVTAVFDEFTKGSEAAAKASLQSATDFAFLTSALKTGQITREKFVEEFAKLKQEAADSAAAFRQGALIQRQYGNAQKETADQVARLVDLYKRGAIDLEALNNATIAALGLDEQAAESARRRADELAALQREADAIRSANLTAQEKFDRAIGRASVLQEQGLLTQQDFNRELERQAGIFAKNTAAADGFGKSVEKSAQAGLKFNEISGIFAALPGPLGNIAGRLSGITSAAQGLQRVFTGDIYNNLASLGSAAASLVNPYTAAAAAVTAFGAAAFAIGRNLISLESELERLTQLSDRLGVSFDFIQVLQVAAVKTGTSVDELGGSFNRFLKSVNDARNGSSAAVQAFGELGLSVTDIQSSTPEQLFTDVAAAVGAIEDPARRAAVAMQLFGKAGLELLPVFDELATAREELERLGAAISDRQREQIARFGDELDRASIAANGFSNQTSAAFANTATNVTFAFTEITAAVNRSARENEIYSEGLANSVADQLPIIGSLNRIGAAMRFFGDETEQASSGVGQLGESLAEAQAEADALQKQLDRVTQSVSSAIDESAAFGQAGFDAALQYQESVAELRSQLERGIINEETFRRSAEQAGNLFQQELSRIERDAEIEIRVKQDAEQAIAKVREELSKAIDESAAFGQAGFDAALEYQRAVEDLQQQFEAGIINEQTLAREAERAQAAYEAQVDAAKKLVDEQRKLIENDQKRIATLLEANDAAARLEEDLQAVQREQARVSAELAAAREADNAAQADAAAARQGELDQLQARLEEQQQALDQGFDQGFQAAFDNVNRNIDGLIAKSQQFGQAGFDAALRLQEGIAAAQQQAKDGILNAEAYQQEVQRQQELFNAELKHLEDVKKQKEKDAAEAVANQKKQNEELLRAQENYRKQQESALQAYQQQQAKAQEEYAKEQQRIFEEQRKAAEAEAKRQEERLRKLNTLGDTTVNAQDIRTGEGAALVLNLAATAQDPTLIQQRLQTKLLEVIATGITRAADNYFNTPVGIVGGSLTLDPRAQQNVRL